MFDAKLRPFIDPPLNRLGRAIARAGVNIAFGSDNMTEDMFHALKIGSIIHRGAEGGSGVMTAPARKAPRKSATYSKEVPAQAAILSPGPYPSR